MTDSVYAAPQNLHTLLMIVATVICHAGPISSLRHMLNYSAFHTSFQDTVGMDAACVCNKIVLFVYLFIYFLGERGRDRETEREGGSRFWGERGGKGRGREEEPMRRVSYGSFHTLHFCNKKPASFFVLF